MSKKKKRKLHAVGLYEYRASLVEVVDGDTIDLWVDLGFSIQVMIRTRLLGVNTPEVYGVKKGTDAHAEGEAASEYVKTWFAERAGWLEVRTYKDRKGKYGRYLAEIWWQGESLNATLIVEGWGDGAA